MAKESSFDVVSTVDIQEVDNAFRQTERELSQRYDLKGSGAQIAFAKGDSTVTISAPSEFVAQQVVDVFNTRLTRQGVRLILNLCVGTILLLQPVLPCALLAI